MKIAGDTTTVYKNVPMQGKLSLQKKKGSYLILNVTKGFADSVFKSLSDEIKGIQEPPDYKPHISVMTDEEVDKVGKIKELGESFNFTIMSIEEVDPEGWPEMKSVYFVECKSEELEDLRKKYGLTPLIKGDHPFHISIAVIPDEKYKKAAMNVFYDALAERVARFIYAEKAKKELSEEELKAETKRRVKKVKSVRILAQDIQKLRNKVTRDLKSDDEKTRMTALAVALIDKTSERVGNDDSATDGHFGVTGWRSKHIDIEGSKVYLKYTGKSGVDHEKEFTDEQIAKMLKECKGRSKSGRRLITTSDGFEIKADKVNRYLKEFDVTAKDLRGYGANNLVIEALRGAPKLNGEDERKKYFNDVLSRVAEKVGHQKATLKKHYLLPNIDTTFIKSGRIVNLKNA